MTTNAMDFEAVWEKRILNAEGITPNFGDVDGALSHEYWDDWMNLLNKENKVRLSKSDDDVFSFLSLESVEYIFTLCLRMHLPGEIRYLAALYFDSFMRKQTRALFNFVNNSDKSAKLKDEEWEKIEAKISSQIPLRICSCIQLASKKFQYHTSLCTNDIVATLRTLGRRYSPAAVAKSELRIVRTLNFAMPRSPIVYPESILTTLSRYDPEEMGIDTMLDIQKCWDYVLLSMDMFFLYHDQYVKILLEKLCPNQEFEKVPVKLIASLKSDYFLLGGAIVLIALIHIHGSRTGEAALTAVAGICHASSDHISEAVAALSTIVHS